MKKLLTEIMRIVKNYPSVWVVLVFDLAGAILLAINPLLVGRCIDDLVAHRFTWLIVLLVVQLVLIIVRAADKYLDTKVYRKITAEENLSYYKRIIKTDASESKINLLLYLVDDVPYFLEYNSLEFFDLIGNITFSLAFLFCSLGTKFFGIAIIVSMIIPFATFKLRERIVKDTEKQKDNDEKRIEVVESRNLKKFEHYLKKDLSLEIAKAKVDTKILIITDFLQLFLLILSIYSTIMKENYTSGQLFTTITYVMTLNNYVSEINEKIIEVKNVKNSVNRLEINANFESIN